MWNCMAGNYTAERCKPKIRAQIVALLAQGEPITRIEQTTKACEHTIRAVRSQESSEISQRKQLIVAQAFRAATTAFDQLNSRLDTEHIPTAMLVPIAGMATDKLALLSAQDPLQVQVQVQHTHDLGQQLYQRLNALAAKQPPPTSDHLASHLPPHGLALIDADAQTGEANPRASTNKKE